jgi:hypothetical protein
MHKGGKLWWSGGRVVGLISGLSCCGVGPESAYENDQGVVAVRGSAGESKGLEVALATIVSRR